MIISWHEKCRFPPEAILSGSSRAEPARTQDKCAHDREVELGPSLASGLLAALRIRRRGSARPSVVRED